jgi:hypothetical protein
VSKFCEAYAELHGIAVGKTSIALQEHIFGNVLKSCCRTELVETLVGQCGSVVLATNETPKDLRRADGLEMIHKVQQVMGASEPPKWYVPEDEEW